MGALGPAAETAANEETQVETVSMTAAVLLGNKPQTRFCTNCTQDQGMILSG